MDQHELRDPKSIEGEDSKQCNCSELPMQAAACSPETQRGSGKRGNDKRFFLHVLNCLCGKAMKSPSTLL